MKATLTKCMVRILMRDESEKHCRNSGVAVVTCGVVPRANFNVQDILIERTAIVWIPHCDVARLGIPTCFQHRPRRLDSIRVVWGECNQRISNRDLALQLALWRKSFRSYSEIMNCSLTVEMRGGIGHSG